MDIQLTFYASLGRDDTGDVAQAPKEPALGRVVVSGVVAATAYTTDLPAGTRFVRMLGNAAFAFRADPEGSTPAVTLATGTWVPSESPFWFSISRKQASGSLNLSFIAR